jgi:hypothetical protein
VHLRRQSVETTAGGRQSSRVLGRQTCYQGQRMVEAGGCGRIRCPKPTCRQSWVHQGTLFNDEQVETNMREAWEHEGSKDEMNIVLQGLEQHFWKGTEADWMGCYDVPGENWAGWIGKQRRYGGRKCLFSTTRSQPCSSSGQRGGGSQFTKTGTSCNSPYSTSHLSGGCLVLLMLNK